MYLDHFQLDQAPFGLTPNLDYYYEDDSQADAHAAVLAALDQGCGFIKITADVGLGKTFLCRRLLSDLTDPYVTAWLPDPHLSPGTLRTALARDFGFALPNRPTQQEVHVLLQDNLTAMVAAGKCPVLLIDEAQALPDTTLETVRLLTNLESEQRKLLQVVLIGQPELDQRLASPGFRQLRQRIVHSCRIDPLDRAGVRRYVRHRLAVAGGVRELFTPAALNLLARSSHGIPRLVNILADKALLSAFGGNRALATRTDVRRAISDTESTRDHLWWPRLLPAVRLAAFSLIAVGVFLALDQFSGSGW